MVNVGFKPPTCKIPKDRKEMKKRIWVFCLIFLTFTTGFAKADTHIVANMPIPDRFRSIFEVCGVQSEEELFEKWAHIVTIYDDKRAKLYPDWCKDDPIQIRYGGTTKELIADKKWSLAIVSSRDVDLQALADKKQMDFFETVGWLNASLSGYRQCLLPEALFAQLPNKNKPFLYDVHYFDYNMQTDDATILIVRHGKREESRWAEVILDARPADMVRELEGIYRAKFWTVDELVERPEDWDTALLDLPAHSGQFAEELQRLDEAGLLCDLSQNAYLASRTDQTFNDCRMLPRGVFSEDSRMVAVPYYPSYDYVTDEREHLFIVNQKSAFVEKALNYGELLLKMTDYDWSGGGDPTLEQARSWYEEACSR